ncbi:ATP-binding protein [Streptomyces sp. NPDC002888]|uniref:ATP-binding protein n=1 Tax=Streptomyces sp. NPDC002888 TaxID=3364668 RepID=UPI00368F1BC3
MTVWDTDPEVPPAFSHPGAPPPQDAEHGRGLHLIRACADAWGASVLSEAGGTKAGKLMWAECGGEAG